MQNWMISAIAAAAITVLILIFDKNALPVITTNNVDKMHIRVLKLFMISFISIFGTLTLVAYSDQKGTVMDIRTGKAPF